jgi:hypothetical protein
MEREDYRRKHSPNVFFGTVKTYHPFGDPNVDEPPSPGDDALRAAAGMPLPWWREVKVNTLWMNFAVMIGTIFVVIVSVLVALRRQLSRV